MSSSHLDLTADLNRWQSLGAEMSAETLSLVYEEVRRIAARHLRREREGHTLQATAVANEVYLRLHGVEGLAWRDRSHFSAFAARLVRRVLVDHARVKGRKKRGGEVFQVSVDVARELAAPVSSDVLHVDEALERLAKKSERMARLVELRFFGGLSFEEIASCLAVPLDLVVLEWRRAKTWLRRELGDDGARP